MILFYVNRRRQTVVHIGVDTHQNVTLLAPKEVNIDRDLVSVAMDGSLFSINDDRHGDVARIMKHLAEQNPGCEFQMFQLERVAQCPAAPMVMKQVTKDGILPVTA
jgi:hypothetical protein